MFCKFTIFKRNGNFKKGSLTGKLAPKPNRIKSVANDRNVNTVWVTLKENSRMT